MNILIFSWRGSGHPHSGGAEVSTYEHAVGWIKRGHEVTLFTSSFEGALGEEIVDGIKIISRGLVDLLSDLDKYNTFCKNCIKWAKNFSGINQ